MAVAEETAVGENTAVGEEIAVAAETAVAEPGAEEIAQVAVADTPLDEVAAAPLAVVAKTVAVRAVGSESAVDAKIGPEEAVVPLAEAEVTKAAAAAADVVVVAEVAAADEPDVGTETDAVKVAVAIQAVAVNHPSLV